MRWNSEGCNSEAWRIQSPSIELSLTTYIDDVNSGLLFTMLPIELHLWPFPMMPEQAEAKLLKVCLVRRNTKPLGYRGQNRSLVLSSLFSFGLLINRRSIRKPGVRIALQGHSQHSTDRFYKVSKSPPLA